MNGLHKVLRFTGWPAVSEHQLWPTTTNRKEPNPFIKPGNLINHDETPPGLPPIEDNDASVVSEDGGGNLCSDFGIDKATGGQDGRANG